MKCSWYEELLDEEQTQDPRWKEGDPHLQNYLWASKLMKGDSKKFLPNSNDVYKFDFKFYKILMMVYLVTKYHMKITIL